MTPKAPTRTRNRFLHRTVDDLNGLGAGRGDGGGNPVPPEVYLDSEDP